MLVLGLVIANIAARSADNDSDKIDIHEMRRLLARYLSKLAMKNHDSEEVELEDPESPLSQTVITKRKHESEEVGLHDSKPSSSHPVKCGKIWCRKGWKCHKKVCRYDTDVSDESTEKCGDSYCKKGVKCEYDPQLKEWGCTK